MDIVFPDLGEGESCATGEEGTDFRLLSGKGLWPGLSGCRSSSDLGKSGAVSEEGTDLGMSERMSKGLWVGLSKCNASDLGSKSGETGEAVSEEGTDLGMSERRKSKRKREMLQKQKEWSEREPKSHSEAMEWVTNRPFVPDTELYFPSTFVRFRPMGVQLPKFPRFIEVTYPSTEDRKLHIVKGKKLEVDIVSLLSNGVERDYLVRNNGVRESVQCIARKHLLICCFKVPVRNDSALASNCRAMIAAYSDLRQSNKNFEMVMVAKMAMAGGDDDEAAFNHFFKAFPCLAVPFSDTKSRDFLCRSFGLTIPDQHYTSVVLDPDQVVLQIDSPCFYNYGALGFPYTDEWLEALRKQDLDARRRLQFGHNNGRLAAPVSLVDLLGSDSLLSKYGSDDKISVLDLSKKKCVALYLCVDGSFMREMEDISQTCEDKNLEFEVILVHLPFHWETASFVSAVENALRHYKLSSSWWVAPFDEKASRRLWWLCGQRDQFFFLADGGKAFELYGTRFARERISRFPDAFPFTRMTMAQDFLDRLESISLKSLLLLPCVNSAGAFVPVSQLECRNVLLYLDSYRHIREGKSSLHRELLHCYDEIKKDYPGLEVVFVPMDPVRRKRAVNIDSARHPWLVLPPAAANEGSIARKLIVDNIRGWPTLVAFGEDGRIRSRKAQHRLKGGSLFADTLFQEIVTNLEGYLSTW